MAAKETTQTYSTADAARWLEVSPSTVVKWDKGGILSPSIEREPGEDRSYSETDLIAMSLARDAIERKLNPYPDSVSELVAMVRNGKREEMERAEIRIYQKLTGFGVFMWIPDVRDRAYMTEIERWKTAQGMKKIGPKQTLWEIVERQRKAFRAGFRDGIRAARAARLGKEN